MQAASCGQMLRDRTRTVAYSGNFIAQFGGRGRDVGLHLRHGRPGQLHREAGFIVLAASHAVSTTRVEPAAVRGRRCTAQ